MRGLIDRQAITDVLVEYCYALDTMELERLLPLFATDCVVDYGPDERLRSSGADALVKSLERLWRWTRTSHHVSNIGIRFTGSGNAEVVSYVYAWHERVDGSTAIICGQYADTFVRNAAGWQIAARRMLMNACSDTFTVEINKLERRQPPPGWCAPDLDNSGDSTRK